MSGDARIDVVIRYGPYGERTVAVVVPLAESLRRDLMRSVELSDNPWSLILASPGMFGGDGNALSIRRATFRMRREIAADIGHAIADQLEKMFGANDELDGYSGAERRDAGTTSDTATLTATREIK